MSSRNRKNEKTFFSKELKLLPGLYVYYNENMNELSGNQERRRVEEEKLRLINLITNLVNNGQIAAVDLDGGKFLDQERRKKLEAQLQLIRRENFPGMSLLRDLQFELSLKVVAPLRKALWEIEKSTGQLPTDLKGRLTAAIQFDLGGPIRVRYGKDSQEYIKELLEREEATVALVDRIVSPEEVQLGMGINSLPAHNLYVQTSNTNLNGSVVEQDGTFHQSDPSRRGNILLVAGLKGSYLTDPKAATNYLRQNIGVLLNSPSVYVKFSGRGFEKTFEGFGQGEELKMKNPRTFKDNNLPAEQIGSTINLMSNLMKA